MTTRYYEETPCPHDRWAEIGHVEDGFDDRTMDYRPPEGKTHPNHWCPGGQRRELTFNYEKAAQTRVFDDERDWDALTETEQAIEVVKAKRVVDAAVIPLEEPE